MQTCERRLQKYFLCRRYVAFPILLSLWKFLTRSLYKDRFILAAWFIAYGLSFTFNFNSIHSYFSVTLWQSFGKVPEIWLSKELYHQL